MTTIILRDANDLAMSSSMVFIDSRVADYQSLIAGLGADSEWMLLDDDRDGVLQVQAN